jgi:hypothetical protein
VSFQRGIDGPEPVRGEPVARVAESEEQRRRAASTRVASGSLACPRCDAPVLPARAVAPTELLGCPYCDHTAAVRDFLSLAEPSRPARVEVRLRRASI